MMNLNLKTSKEQALREYKEAKANYLKNMSNENWIIFCNCKSVCRALGVRI